MADSLFTKFFDKIGVDMNLGATSSQVSVIYSDEIKDVITLSGKIFFPKVSIKLIESQQLYILQEVTGPTSSFELRKIPGSASVISGSDYVTGFNTDFTSLTSGVNVKIGNNDYTVSTIIGATSMQLSSTVTVSETTDNLYWYDYVNYSQPRSSIDTHKEFINVYFENESQNSFFLYNIDYTEEVPFIQKSYQWSFELPNGSSDVLDSFTGRIQISDPITEPLQINIGLSSDEEGIYEEKLIIEVEKQYIGNLVSSPIVTSDQKLVLIIDGTSHLQYILNNSVFYFQGITGSTFSTSFYEKKLHPISLGITGSDTFIVFEYEDIPLIPTGSLNSYRLLWKNIDIFSSFDLYGETEGEDERFRFVLENFGKKIDFDKEYIFRDSDINEELSDFRLLNKKRKELLIEGDNIFPYIGSYKSLINIINYFGYYDLDIKEYFLNIDEKTPNFGKFMQVLIPRNDEQRKLSKAIWEIVPSKMWKKTSYFGLFYDINKITDNYDNYGIPIVEDAFMFSPEEVLIKLFGLKELLKEYFLPLNARIIDITGEGIYFERIRVDSWSDNLNYITINIGQTPQFVISPSISYVSDLRRLDDFYVKKFTEQGLTGFLGPSATNPFICGTGDSGSIVLDSLYSTNLESYSSFMQSPYDINGELVAPVDNTWDYMPRGISNPDFNNIARRISPLPDTLNIPAGAPILLEAIFDIKWEEGSFNWSHLAILGSTGSPNNINFWTWESIGRGQYIDCRWIIQKGGLQPFSLDTGRKPISEYDIIQRGATSFSIPAKMQVTGMSGSSITSVQIINSGYGYTSLPTVSIIGTTGSSASVEISLSEGGYIIGGTVTDGGTGYASNVDDFGIINYPTVIIDEPSTQYETTTKTLHAISLPFEGEYQIGLYTYDITNNFTVQFDKHVVNARKTEFVSVHRKETWERTWKDFETSVSEGIPDHLSFGELPTSGSRLVEWDEVTGPWYYPIHVFSSWDDAKISWESLNYSQIMDQALYQNPLSTSFIELDRTSEYVTLSGDLLSLVDIGDSLFFVRNESDIIEQNVSISPNSIGFILPGTLSGIVGATSVSTSVSTETFISSGNHLFFNGTWYDVENVDSSNIYLSSNLATSGTNINSVYYSSTREVPIIGFTQSMSKYSRILLTDNDDFSSMNTAIDFYRYVDSLSFVGATVMIKSDDTTIRKIIEMNTSADGGQNTPLYATWGLFAGTYAIEVSGKSLTGGNTRFNLHDVNKELYYIDGNFTITNADYDVDYAESRIGSNSLTYENANETTWEEAKPFSWFGLEYHGGVHCGFAIPFISPGGSIRIDEYPSFQFSGNYELIANGVTGAKSSLQIGANELSLSTNEGIRKFDYSVLPQDELYLKTNTGQIITILSASYSNIVLSDIPNQQEFKIPATIDAVVDNGSLIFNITSNGYGYANTPIVTIPSPGSTGVQASVICVLADSQVVSLNVISAGSGYTSSPVIEVSYPQNFKQGDNSIWTGNEWHIAKNYDIGTNTLLIDNDLVYPVIIGQPVLLPYEYHKQLVNSTLLQQFYFFIHAKAVNPSSEMLSYVSFDNGVEGEWLDHQNRSCSYPLRNSILYGSISGYDYLTQKWEYEGSDYPPLSVPSDYSSDTQSIQSRIPYLQTLQSPYSFNDTVISSNQQVVPSFTPVIFNYDYCKIPGKNNPTWTIINDETGIIQAISKSKNFMWNFTKDGNYSVKLEIEDANGNKSVLQKNSFIVIGKPKKIIQPLGRNQIKPINEIVINEPSINILANDV